MMNKPHYLYRIYYGDTIVYLGRTNQRLQDRIRGHLFKKPMHRTISIGLVTKIEYAEFSSEADMNVYEIYYINKYKPALNCDDKVRDELTITLPEVEWCLFETPLWDKWKEEIRDKDELHQMRQTEKHAYEDTVREMRRMWHEGKITEDEYYAFKESGYKKEKFI